jgi:hypothetical protein
MTTESHDRLNLAAKEFLARKDRVHHPNGVFDNLSRWEPIGNEAQDCCNAIRPPSANYPYSLLLHCRSLKHIARLYQVDEKALRKRVREMRPPNPPRREGGDNYYEAVALMDDGRMLSLYDGTTEYVLGKTVEDVARQNFGGGLYCYRSINEALDAKVRVSANVRTAKRVIICVRAEGAYCIYPDGKFAFSRLTPLDLVAL